MVCRILIKKSFKNNVLQAFTHLRMHSNFFHSLDIAVSQFPFRDFTSLSFNLNFNLNLNLTLLLNAVKISCYSFLIFIFVPLKKYRKICKIITKTT